MCVFFMVSCGLWCCHGTWWRYGRACWLSLWVIETERMLIIGFREGRPWEALSAVTQTVATVSLTAGAVMRQEQRLFQPSLCNLLPPQLVSSPCLRHLRTTCPLSQSQSPREMHASCSSLSKGGYLVSYSILLERKHNVQINLRLGQTDHDVS